MNQTRRSTRRAAFGEGDMPCAVTRSDYSAPFLAADATRPTTKSSMPGAGRLSVLPVISGSIEQRRTSPAIGASQKAITARGHGAPASMKDLT